MDEVAIGLRAAAVLDHVDLEEAGWRVTPVRERANGDAAANGSADARASLALSVSKALHTAEHGAVLVAIAHEVPRSSLDGLTREFNRLSGLSVCSATVRKGLRQAGIKRMRPTRKPAERAAAQGGTPVRVGYTARHRRDGGASGMNTDLTDPEWALVADLFKRRGGRGAPPTHDRRLLLNACAYVVPSLGSG